MSRYKPYPEYKDSGVEWLGEVPEHWAFNKLRYIFRFTKGLTITKADLKETGVPCVNYGEIHSKYGFEVSANRDVLKNVDESYLSTDKSALMFPGDFAFADTSEDFDGAGNFTHVVGSQKLFAGYHTIVAKAINGINSRFLAYQIDSTQFRTQIQLAVKGVKVFSITQAILRDSLVWLPDAAEQAAIANFLDRETAKIDTLIEKQQRLIELLQEKIISIAMNEQINGKGNFERLRHLTKAIERPVELNSQDEYVALGLYNRGRGLFHKPIKFGNEMGDSDFFYIESGDLILSGQFAWEGAVALAKDTENGCVVSHRYPILRGEEICTEYLLALFMTDFGSFLLNECSRGAAGRNRPLNISLLLSEKIRIPSMSAQNCVKILVHKKLKIEQKANQAITLLKERRTALISAAVTGKIDVRGEAE